MERIYFSENLIRLRREKKVTQEQLADFLGVTKASVSKWETKQSMPDILLLPKLATYFDVTIDTLLGYEPQLSKEQIQRIYAELSKDFADKEFEIVMEHSRELVKQYYSCYEFLSRIVCLWLNHYMLSGVNRSEAILEEAVTLCEHILANCKDIALCKDVLLLKASILLQQKKPLEVIEILESSCNPCSLENQGEGILISAYLQVENISKANGYTQMAMYNHLMALVGCAQQYLTLHKENLALCEETFRRISQVAEIYHLEHLNFNIMALVSYQMAIIYCQHEKKQQAIEQLSKFVRLTDGFLNSDTSHLRSDAYFDALDTWFEEVFLSGNIPRDKRVIYESMLLAFDTPAFEVLKEKEDYQKLKKIAEKRGEQL